MSIEPGVNVTDSSPNGFNERHHASRSSLLAVWRRAGCHSQWRSARCSLDRSINVNNRRIPSGYAATLTYKVYRTGAIHSISGPSLGFSLAWIFVVPLFSPGAVQPASAQRGRRGESCCSTEENAEAGQAAIKGGQSDDEAEDDRYEGPDKTVTAEYRDRAKHGGRKDEKGGDVRRRHGEGEHSDQQKRDEGAHSVGIEVVAPAVQPVDVEGRAREINHGAGSEQPGALAPIVVGVKGVETELKNRGAEDGRDGAGDSVRQSAGVPVRGKVHANVHFALLLIWYVRLPTPGVEREVRFHSRRRVTAGERTDSTLLGLKRQGLRAAPVKLCEDRSGGICRALGPTALERLHEITRFTRAEQRGRPALPGSRRTTSKPRPPSMNPGQRISTVRGETARVHTDSGFSEGLQVASRCLLVKHREGGRGSFRCLGLTYSAPRDGKVRGLSNRAALCRR